MVMKKIQCLTYFRLSALILPKQPFDITFRTLALLVAEIQVILYIYLFTLFHFFSHIKFFKIFINIHEIEDQITLLSDFRVIRNIVITFI